MPIQTTPGIGNSVDAVLALAGLLRPEWDERHARIPAWHPRMEVDPAAAAAAAQQAQIDWESDDNPYRKRFTDTQSAFTKNQQRLSELERLEQDPQAYLEVGKKNGWIEIEEPPAGGGQGAGEPDPYAERFAALEARQAAVDARIAAENAAAGEEMFYQDLDKWAGEAGVKLSKADHNAMLWMVVNSPNPEDEATARQVFDAHVADKKAEREAIEAEVREAMKRPRVPHVPSAGGAAETGVPDWSGMSRAEIDRYMAERVRASS